MEPKRSVLILLHLVLTFRFCHGDFPTDYLGKYLSDEEYNTRSFCWTEVCIRDSGRLIYSASHDSAKIDPCDDFPSFAMAEFQEHRVPNERYAKLGFTSDVEAQFFEKQKRILNEPSKPDAPTIFKVVKSFFKKCINTAAIISNGPADMVSYMKKLNLPIALGKDWHAENFEIQSLFHCDPDLAFGLFFDLKVVRRNNELRGEKVDAWRYNRNTHNDSLDIMKTLKADDILTKEAVADFTTFLEMKVPVEDEYYREGLPASIGIFSDSRNCSKQSLNEIIKNFVVHLGFDPAKPLNVVYPTSTLHFFISKIMEKLSKRTIANIFTVALARQYQKAFITYSFTKQEENFYGTKRSYQRFEQCVQFIESNMQPAFDALLAEKLFDKSVQAAAREMAEEVINDSPLHEIYGYGRDVETSVMFSDDITNVTKVSEAYKGLRLNGSESFVELYIDISKFNKTLQVFEVVEQQEPVFSEAFFAKLQKANFLPISLSIPVQWTLYPYFHPARARFLNTAAFYRKTLQLLLKDPRKIQAKEISPIDLAYKNYEKWLDKGNQDLHLPAFKMTNRQMFWLSVTHVMTDKYQFRVSQTFELAQQLTNEYMHVILKNKDEFRKDFQCDEMTPTEKQRFEEFQTKVRYMEKSLTLKDIHGGVFVPEKYFIELRESGLFNFVESVLKDPKYTAEIMRELVKDNQWTYPMSVIFSMVCPTDEGCQVWL